MKKNSLKNKKFFITGHTGFKGSWLCILLNHLGASVYGYSLKPEKNSLYIKAKIFSIIKKSIIGDIRNYNKLSKEIIKIKPDYIIHLAAQSLVVNSYTKPMYTFDVNVNGTLNIVDISRKIKSLKNTLIITTDKVYNNNINKSYSENDNLKGKDPYSGSKVCAENIVYSYNESFFSKFLVARSGNVVGGGDTSKNRIIPDIIKSIQNGKKLVLRNPNNVRPWQHVIEPLYGYLLLILKKNAYKDGYAWNFGPKDKYSKKVINVVKKFEKFFLFNYIVKDKFKFKETKILNLNSNKALKKLKWSQTWNFNETINKVIEWEKMIKNNITPFDACINQIKKYIKTTNKN